MAQSGYTPIQLYYSATAAATPSAGNLAAGELALNTNDGKLYYKDSGGSVQTLARSGTLPVASGGTGATSLTANNVILGNGTSAVQFVAPGTSGNVLTSNGTTWASAANTSLLGQTDSASPFETSIGYQAGNVTTGTSNTFIGYQSGLVVSNGNNNTAIGATAFIANTTGANNTAVGTSALASTVSAVTGSTAVGYAALANATGGSNTGLGNQAGSNTTTGTSNTYVGFQASASNSTISNEIVVGASLTGKGAASAFIGGTNGAYNAKNVTTWETTSDQRIKKNIAQFNQGLDVLNQIQVKNFEYRSKEEITELDPSVAVERSGVQIGIIAQELQQVLPQCVTENSTGVLSVNTDSLVWYLINAVKQLSAEVEQLKQR